MEESVEGRLATEQDCSVEEGLEGYPLKRTRAGGLRQLVGDGSCKGGKCG